MEQGRATARIALTIAALAAALLGGCATSLSSFQPAHVPPKHHVQAEGGVDVSLPVGAYDRTVEAGKTLARRASQGQLTDAEKQQVVEAGVNLVFNPPFFVQHLGLAFTPFADWEVGLRYSADAWRVGTRFQLVHRERSGFDLSVGAGLQRFDYSLVLPDVLNILQVQDYTRWNVDLPLTIGRSGSWYRLWGGPRLVWSRFSTAMTLNLPATSVSPAEMLSAAAHGSGFYAGAQGGMAFGYRKLFLGFELTVVRFFANIAVSTDTHVRNVDLGTLVIYPGIALMGEF